MVDDATADRDVPAILTEPFGAVRLARALLPVWCSILVRPKRFFGSVGGANGPLLRNAVGFLALALAIYVGIQTIFEVILIHFFQYEGPTFLAYYAADYEPFDRPLAEVASFFTILVIFAATCAFQVFTFGASLWTFARCYVHFGEIASFKAVLVAMAYATAFVMLTFSFLSIPLIALSGGDDPTFLFYFFGPLTAGDGAQYELALTFFYVRAISFTMDIMLHWGIVFTILAVYAGTWLTSVL